MCLSVSYTGKDSVYASTLFTKKERTVCLSMCACLKSRKIYVCTVRGWYDISGWGCVCVCFCIENSVVYVLLKFIKVLLYCISAQDALIVFLLILKQAHFHSLMCVVVILVVCMLDIDIICVY